MLTKFYKNAQTRAESSGHVIVLDAKPARTPLRNLLRVASPALAAAMAEEWAQQDKNIIPASMPLTQLACTLIDKSAGDERADMNARLAAYGASDLVCYRADHPASLAARQAAAWDPLLAWLKEAHGIELLSVSGIGHQAQPAASLEKIRRLAEELPDIDFTAAQAAAAITGSLAIALALLHGRLNADEAWAAAFLDDIYQLETWGEDAAARAVLEQAAHDLHAVARFLELAKASS